jgi:hypothetical protein
MKVGDLVRYRSNLSPNTIGIVTAKVGSWKIMVTALNTDDPWFSPSRGWDISHWKVISESG